jgi:hypothetical protein
MGHPCGTPFFAKDLLAINPSYQDEAEFLKDMPTQPRTVFSAHYLSAGFYRSGQVELGPKGRVLILRKAGTFYLLHGLLPER